MSSPAIGVIGLGAVGGGVALCLARAGTLAAVHARRPETATALPGVPASVASPAALAATCDIVIIAVMSADQAIDVLAGPAGVLTHARAGMVIVLLSTVSLADLARIRALTDAAGVALIDSPVIGAAQAAENGIICFVGAEDAALARARGAFAGFARAVEHLGGPGAGMAAKLARNIMVYTAWAGAHEAARFAATAGVDIERIAAAIDRTGRLPGGSTTWLGPRDAIPADARDRALTMFRKDLAAALDHAEAVGLDLPISRRSLDEAAAIVGQKIAGGD